MSGKVSGQDGASGKVSADKTRFPRRRAALHAFRFKSLSTTPTDVSHAADAGAADSSAQACQPPAASPFLSNRTAIRTTNTCAISF